PDDRFPSCRDMVRALREADGESNVAATAAMDGTDPELQSAVTSPLTEAPFGAPRGDPSEDQAHLTPDSVQAVTQWIGQITQDRAALPSVERRLVEAARTYPVAAEVKGT